MAIGMYKRHGTSSTEKIYLHFIVVVFHIKYQGTKGMCSCACSAPKRVDAVTRPEKWAVLQNMVESSP